MELRIAYFKTSHLVVELVLEQEHVGRVHERRHVHGLDQVHNLGELLFAKIRAEI